jgi:S1-C subfamily serine protease
VQIGLRLNRRELPVVLGTGFLADDRATVVTAAHVLEQGMALANHVELQTGVTFDAPPFVAALAHPNVIETPNDGTFRSMEAFTYLDMDLLSMGTDHDIAAGRLKQNPFQGLDPEAIPVIGGVPHPPLFGIAELDQQRPREGATVAVSGYPLRTNALVTSSGIIASAWTADLPPEPPRAEPKEGDDQGVHQEVTWSPGEVRDRYLADLEANPGNSGGPVYLQETGAVIGVCVATRPAPVRTWGADDPAKLDGKMLAYSSGLTIIIPTGYVNAMLRHPHVAS